MKVSVFGLGYVGIVTALCLAKEGHHVIGVEKNEIKIQELKKGRLPIFEPGLDTLLSEVTTRGNLELTLRAEDAVLRSDISIIAVGTYSSADGYPDLRGVFRSMDEIGDALRKKMGFHSIVIRSTVPPGTTAVALRRVEAKSGKKLKKDFGGGMNPEFLREGVALKDFYNPPFVVVGTDDETTNKLMREMFSFIKAPYYSTEIRLAEILKYSCNAFHALKIAFCNEIGRVCAGSEIDSQVLMEIFVKDHLLNISPKYLRPGAPFGGSCLPKDLRALVSFAESKGVQVPLMDAVLDSNDAHFAEVIRKVEKAGCNAVGVLGLTFKENTDDVRESPVLKLVRCLIDRGFDVKVYDKNLCNYDVVGTNRDYLFKQIPEYSEISVNDLRTLFEQSQLLLITNGQYAEDEEFRVCNRDSAVKILDLSGDYKKLCPEARYNGLCW